MPVNNAHAQNVLIRGIYVTVVSSTRHSILGLVPPRPCARTTLSSRPGTALAKHARPARPSASAALDWSWRLEERQRTIPQVWHLSSWQIASSAAPVPQWQNSQLLLTINLEIFSLNRRVWSPLGPPKQHSLSACFIPRHMNMGAQVNEGHGYNFCIHTQNSAPPIFYWKVEWANQYWWIALRATKKEQKQV